MHSGAPGTPCQRSHALPGRQTFGTEGRGRPPRHDALVAAPPPLERRGGRTEHQDAKRPWGAGGGDAPQGPPRPHRGGHEGLQGSRSFWRRQEVRGPLRGASCKPSDPVAGWTARPARPAHRMPWAASGCTGATAVPGINPPWHIAADFPACGPSTRAGIAGADPASAVFRPGGRAAGRPAALRPCPPRRALHARASTLLCPPVPPPHGFCARRGGGLPACRAGAAPAWIAGARCRGGGVGGGSGRGDCTAGGGGHCARPCPAGAAHAGATVPTPGCRRPSPALARRHPA